MFYTPAITICFNIRSTHGNMYILLQKLEQQPSKPEVYTPQVFNSQGLKIGCSRIETVNA